MAIFEINTDCIRKFDETSFGETGLQERGDLQRLLRKQIDVITPDTLIISEECGEWDDCKRRIDLLGIDKAANLVVFELKRTEDGGHMELQAIRYAAMVSTMTFDKVVEIYSRFLTKIGSNIDPQSSILAHLDWPEPDEDHFAQDVRIVLVSADFSKELTTSVMWLNKRDLDIRCIRIKPYRDNGRTLIDVQQVIPLPEADEYQIQIREKEQKSRQDRAADRHTLRRKFWDGLLIRAEQKTQLHANISAGDYHAIGAGSGIRGVMYQYVIRQDGSSLLLYIDRGAGQALINKKMFDALRVSKDDIERSFGGPLLWQRLDDKQACLIEYAMELGGWKDEQSKWPMIQDAMIEAMIRFENALAPFVAKLRVVVI